MDLNITETDSVTEDHSWLASAHGLEATATITLSLDDFDADQYADGVIPSGMPLGIITASGKYGVYDPDDTNGTETCVGFLAWSVNVATATTGDFMGALLDHGIIDESALPANHDLDANGKTDVGARFIFR